MEKVVVPSMINAIIEAIRIALNKEFENDDTIDTETVKQGLSGPCFFIVSLNHSSQLFLGNRYIRKNHFCIQYLPESQNNVREECNEVAERLFSCLEWILVEGDLRMGTHMRCEIIDGVLNFFVNYNIFVYRTTELEPSMETMSNGIKMKEGV